jgi:hypothetical protein
MFGYPFSIHYLKTNLSRNEIADRLTNITFLSDLNYKKTPGEKWFYGEVSQFDFSLESIAKQSKHSNFAEGRILGADNDMYIELKLGSFQHQRMYIIFFSLLLILFGFNMYYAAQDPQGFQYSELFYQMYGYDTNIFLYNLSTPISLVLITLQLVIGASIFIKYKNHRKSIPNTISWFNELWNATEIQKSQVPTVLI